MHGLPVELRTESFSLCLLGAQNNHISGYIAAVDVQAGAEERYEQAAGATSDVKGGIPVPLD